MNVRRSSVGEMLKVAWLGIRLCRSSCVIYYVQISLSGFHALSKSQSVMDRQQLNFSFAQRPHSIAVGVTSGSTMKSSYATKVPAWALSCTAPVVSLVTVNRLE